MNLMLFSLYALIVMVISTNIGAHKTPSYETSQNLHYVMMHYSLHHVSTMHLRMKFNGPHLRKGLPWVCICKNY
jgi:hypothetical protein